MRDATLRAISLSCSSNFSLCFSHLLQNVTLSLVDVFNFHQLLINWDGENGKLVRSLYLKANLTSTSQRKSFVQQATSYSNLPPSITDIETRTLHGTSLLMKDSFFETLVNRESLIIELPILIFGFRQQPHSFLVNSLKRLYIGSSKRDNLTAKNVIWILLFIPHLSTAALKFQFSLECYKFMRDFKDSFVAKSSVKNLSLECEFISNDSVSWWDQAMGFDDGNKKTIAVFHLLFITNQLQTLELASNGLGCSGETFLFSNCLMKLERSFKSLKHLRIIGLPHFEFEDPSWNFYSNFEAMKLLTADQSFLRTSVDDVNLMLPFSLEVIYLPYYSESCDEDALLLSLVKSKSLPKLREVVVPQLPLDCNGIEHVLHVKDVWTKNRRLLEEAEIFADGRVKLRKLAEGEVGESEVVCLYPSLMTQNEINEEDWLDSRSSIPMDLRTRFR